MRWIASGHRNGATKIAQVIIAFVDYWGAGGVYVETIPIDINPTALNNAERILVYDTVKDGIVVISGVYILEEISDGFRSIIR